MKKVIKYIILIIAITIIYCSYISKKQNEIYMEKLKKILNIKESILTSKEIDESLAYIKELKTYEPNNVLLHIYESRLYTNNKQYKKSQELIEKAISNRPILKENTTTLIEYAKILYMNKDYYKSKQLLEKAKKVCLDKNLEKEIDRLMKQISKIGESNASR
ncbi:MAG: tetratricopeptide repeat protein [Paraclostridium sp.]